MNVLPFAMLTAFGATLLVLVVASSLAAMFPSVFMRRFRDAYLYFVASHALDLVGGLVGRNLVFSLAQAGIFSMGAYALYLAGQSLLHKPPWIPWQAFQAIALGLGLVIYLPMGHQTSMLPALVLFLLTTVWLGIVIVRQGVRHALGFVVPMVGSSIWLLSYGWGPTPWISFALGACLQALGAIGLLAYALLELKGSMDGREEAWASRLSAAQSEALHYQDLLMEYADDRLPVSIKRELRGEKPQPTRAAGWDEL